MNDMVRVSDIVLVRKGRVLLVQQKNTSAFGKWGLPGGKADGDETPKQTLYRELQEELGIVLAGEPWTLGTHQGARSDERHLLVTTFVADMPATRITLAPDELLGYGWFTPEEVHRLGPSVRSSWMTDMIERGLSQLSGNMQ